MSNWFSVIKGNNLDILDKIPSESIHCCVTSPPYWALRDYFTDDQLGLEETPGKYLSNLMAVVNKIHRVLRKDGTFWIVIGDTYSTPKEGSEIYNSVKDIKTCSESNNEKIKKKLPPGMKTKNLVGIPWMLAFAMRDAGWILRCDVIWHKTDGMPDGAKDRPTRNHEYIFLFSKSPRYYYDYESVREKTNKIGGKSRKFGAKHQPGTGRHDKSRTFVDTGERNLRSVWSVAVSSNKTKHRAVFPLPLIKPCVIASSPDNGIVLDPFSGSGTTGVVSIANNRNYIGIEINDEYVDDSRNRIDQIDPMFVDRIDELPLDYLGGA